MKKIMLILIIIGIVYLSNTPGLRVSELHTWFNEPRFETNIEISQFFDTTSDFYLPWEDFLYKEFILHKLGHIGAYGLLSVFIYLNLKSKSFRLTRVWLLTTAFAITDEVHQYYIYGRSGRVIDIAFDSLICLITIVLIYLSNRKKEKILANHQEVA